MQSKLLILDEEREHGAELEKSLADVKSRSEESENNLKELESTLESVRLEKEETEKRLRKFSGESLVSLFIHKRFELFSFLLLIK